MILNKLKGIYASFVIAIGLGTIIFFIFFWKKKCNARNVRKYCRLFFTFCGIKLEKIGNFDLSAKLIVMNHQSYVDIIVLEGYHPQNICWVAKKELGEIPYYGYALRGPEMILIDREDKKGLVFLLKEAKEKLDQNRPLVIFPEGTRSIGGKKFLPFRSGAKLLAEKFNLKIQPIVLINSRKVYNSSPVESTSNVMRMVILDSFVPEVGSDWYERLESQMQEVYLKHYEELNP
ncbi:lysophospholipid acyltransferase family protein [Helicobacter cappadocius]|uniref:1-acyl-sn-glycerol-3-phosphate acyltransferase n=1 Tax=Helicobacter cappadocius TaxID=3063998 RepID=A0AA90PUJ1_9HELI|nr:MULTISPECIES: lysophospholipid acyltransferase family protein [unclassified Helicobacter]MDO7253850.1 lysophospholipid acyltransferase family protein [Helicobacter sp. faydin-H75]MDP2539804.1 lysophospholipid acyltransferase family protein [Helicobacter sp. faydin-H76]